MAKKTNKTVEKIETVTPENETQEINVKDETPVVKEKIEEVKTEEPIKTIEVSEETPSEPQQPTMVKLGSGFAETWNGYSY